MRCAATAPAAAFRLQCVRHARTRATRQVRGKSRYRANVVAHVTRPNLDLRFVHRFTSGALDVVELYDMTALPGEPHIFNGHAGVENILVNESTLRVGPTDSAIVLEAGDFVSFAADGPHVYSCESTEPVRAMLAMRHPADSIAGPANDSVILALTDQQSPDLSE